MGKRKKKKKKKRVREKERKRIEKTISEARRHRCIPVKRTDSPTSHAEQKQVSFHHPSQPSVCAAIWLHVKFQQLSNSPRRAWSRKKGKYAMGKRKKKKMRGKKEEKNKKKNISEARRHRCIPVKRTDSPTSHAEQKQVSFHHPYRPSICPAIWLHVKFQQLSNSRRRAWGRKKGKYEMGKRKKKKMRMEKRGKEQEKKN